MVEDYPLLTIVPPVLAIALVLLTRRVLLSLGAGVVASALLVAGGDPLETARLVWSSFAVIFWEDGGLNTFYVYILVFTLLLGIIAALIMMSGGTQAFSDWAVQRIRTRRGAKVLPAILGIVIFIDDYFNALAVGQVSRPVTDQHHVSRAKLAYIVDSTSAPVAVLAPFSSWGATIIGIMAPWLAASTLTHSNVGAFLGAATMNYYAIIALLMVWATVLLHIEIGPMRSEERRAIAEGRMYNPTETIPGELAEHLPVHRPGAMRALVIPFVLLVLGVLAGIAWTGWRESASLDPLEIFASTDVSTALLWGGVLGLAAALYYYLRDTSADPRFKLSTLAQGFWEGIKSMLPAISILLLAWMLGDLIDQLGTGEYLGSLVESAAIAPTWLIPLMFVIAGAMAFSTGTSWGSFGLLLPIAGQIMNNVEGGDELLLASFGAVLAGAVLGDHCSPISDTTILSSTGSGANVITHVTTQLPYAMVSGAIALLGYVVYALTGHGILGLLTSLAGLAAFVVIVRVTMTPLEQEIPEDEQAAHT